MMTHYDQSSCFLLWAKSYRCKPVLLVQWCTPPVHDLIQSVLRVIKLIIKYNLGTPQNVITNTSVCFEAR